MFSNPIRSYLSAPSAVFFTKCDTDNAGCIVDIYLLIFILLASVYES